MAFIYKVENLINHNCYIGQTTNIEKRWNKHKTEPFNTKSKAYEYPLYRAIRKYGLENFAFEILEECKVVELNEKEMYYIQKFNSYFHGYNQTLGGDARSVVEKEKIIGIIQDLKTTDLLQKEIAKKWNISEEMVQGINTGRYWKQDIEYPIRGKSKNSARKTRKRQNENDARGKLKEYLPYHRFCSICGKEISRDAKFCIECGHNNARKCERPSKEELYNLLKKHKSFTYVANLFNVSDNAVKKWCKQYGIPHLISDYIKKIKKVKKPHFPKRPIHMIDIKTNQIIKTFSSQAEAEIELRGKCTDAITKVLSGKKPSMYGYKWAYADENSNNT